jgi:2-oxoglutarate dehydrogenase E2 component (dihydrolipoamide succinyltransferase)
MPETGSPDGASVLAWLKQPGDQVEAEEPICLVTWDDVTAEVASPATGVMRMLALAPGNRALSGGSLAIIDVGVGLPAVAGAEPAIESPPSQPPPSEPQPPIEQTQVVPEHLLRDAPVAEPRRRNPEAFLSPAVRHFVSEHALDPSEVAGSGRGGRISVDDLRARDRRGPESGG